MDGEDVNNMQTEGDMTEDAGGMMDLEEMDRRICGDLGKFSHNRFD